MKSRYQMDTKLDLHISIDGKLVAITCPICKQVPLTKIDSYLNVKGVECSSCSSKRVAEKERL